MNEEKAARYHRLRRLTEVAEVAWGAAVLGTAALTGATVGLREAASAAGLAPWASAVVVALALGLACEAGALPLAVYGGFHLERRYGMSRQRLSRWLRDHVTALAVSAALGLPAIAGLYAAMQAWPHWWWLVSAAGLALGVTLLAALAPLVLLPLFFRCRPLDRAALAGRLESLAARAGTPVLGVFEWQLGERTSKANAALAGLGRTRRILVSDTMLDRYSDDEIEVVLAHEMAHHVHHDLWRALAVEAALVTLGLLAAHVLLAPLAAQFGLDGPADPAGVPLLLLVGGLVAVVLVPLALALSRRHERRADGFAIALTGNPGAFVSALTRLGAQNLAEERPPRWARWFFHSHPPLAERLAWARDQASARSSLF